MTTILGISAIALYLATSGWLARRLARHEVHHGTLPLLPGLAAALLHAAFLYQGICCAPEGLDLNLFNALSLVTWLTATLLLLSSLGRPLHSLVMVMLPITALALALELTLGHDAAIAVAGKPELQIHILVSLVAYSLLTLAALQAGVLAIQHNAIHRHQPGNRFIRALPPLQAMEALLFQLIGVGFLLLSGALVTGFIYLEDMFAQHVVHKTILSVVGWIVFATLLVGRLRFGWRGSLAIRWTLGGFIILILAYFGSKFALEWVLGG